MRAQFYAHWGRKWKLAQGKIKVNTVNVNLPRFWIVTLVFLSFTENFKWVVILLKQERARATLVWVYNVNSKLFYCGMGVKIPEKRGIPNRKMLLNRYGSNVINERLLSFTIKWTWLVCLTISGYIIHFVNLSRHDIKGTVFGRRMTSDEYAMHFLMWIWSLGC